MLSPWLRFGLDWHSHSPEEQRTQLKDHLLSDHTWLEPTDSSYEDATLDWPEDDPRFGDPDWDPTKDPDYDPTPRQHSLNTDQLRHKQRTWFHVSPEELEPGTRLKPGVGTSYDIERGKYRKPQWFHDDFENPLDLPPDDVTAQANYVWMAPKLAPNQEEFQRFRDMNPHLGDDEAGKYFDGQPDSATWWKKHMYDVRPGWGEERPAHIYEIKPNAQPQPWNMNYGLGWAAPEATVVRKVDPSEWAKQSALHFERSSEEPTNWAWLHDDGWPLSEICWNPDDGEVNWLTTHKNHRMKGHGRALFNWVRDNHQPDLHHSDDLTDDGRGFAQHVGRAA